MAKVSAIEKNNIRKRMSANQAASRQKLKEIAEDFFICFWNRRMALDRKNYKAVVETTVEIAKKVTGSEVMNKIVLYLKDENELFR